MRKGKEVLDDAICLDILALCDGKRNITQIQEELSLTYKTVLQNLKHLKKAKIINFEGEVKQKGVKPFIAITEQRLSEEIGAIIRDHQRGREEIKSLLKDKRNKELIEIILDKAQKQRFFNLADIKLKSFAEISTVIQLEHALKKSHLIRSRIEITRAGGQFLKDLK